jgi:hypothetical protein
MQNIITANPASTCWEILHHSVANNFADIGKIMTQKDNSKKFLDEKEPFKKPLNSRLWKICEAT